MTVVAIHVRTDDTTDPVRWVAERNGAEVAAAIIDPLGTPTRPDHPAVRLTPDDPSDAVEPLLRVAVRAADDAGVDPLGIAWDPMDVGGLRILQDLGFRPTGEMPYFDLGGGQVEYVTGYRDPTGSRMDLVRTKA